MTLSLHEVSNLTSQRLIARLRDARRKREGPSI